MSEDLRGEVVGALTNVLSNAGNYPERAQSRLLGQDMGPLRTKVADVILPIIARERAAAKAERPSLNWDYRPSWDDRKTLLEVWQEHAPLPDIGLRDGIFQALLAVADWGYIASKKDEGWFDPAPTRAAGTEIGAAHAE